MQPDTTPDLDEMERNARAAIGARRADDVTLACRADCVLDLIRAARERDELRAKVDRLVSRGIEDLRHENDELRARADQLEKNGSFAVGMASETAVFWRERCDAERARAEKAEALVRNVLAVHDASASTGSGVYEMHPDWVWDARAALAQKEPR